MPLICTSIPITEIPFIYIFPEGPSKVEELNALKCRTCDPKRYQKNIIHPPEVKNISSKKLGGSQINPPESSAEDVIKAGDR
jgi:hypothetical protein